MLRSILSGVLLFSFASWSNAADWPAFRGPRGDGQSTEPNAPMTWSQDKNVKWKTPLTQPSNGSPIVSNGRVFVAGTEDAKGRKRSLFCFDRRGGKPLWSQTVEFDRDEETHNTNPHGSSTPVADGKCVVVWHGSAGLFCYDFDGKQRWGRSLGEFKHIWGYGTSPVIYRDQVIMHCSPGAKIFLMALDLATGETRWTAEEPVMGDGSFREDKKYMGSWCTPVVANVGGKDQVICTMPTRVVAYDPADGKVLWSCDGIHGDKGDLAYSSPTIVGDVCVSIGGFGGPGMGFKLGGTGDITATNRLWRVESNPQSIGSSVAVGNFLYRPNAGPGTVDCMEPATGKILWTDRAPDAVMWGSIVAVAGRCYVTNQKGTTIVFKPNHEKFELLAKNDLGEATNATPAISDGQIFLRTNQHLYCIGE